MPRIFGRTIPSVQFAYKTLRIKSHKPTVEDQNAPVYHTKPRPSDLTEHQWVRAMPLFPEKIIYSKNRKTPIRVLLNATMYRLINDKTLRQTVVEAPDFPPWGSIHFFEETMRRQGLWPEFLKRIGRLDLMEVLKKRMRLTPEQMRLSLERARMSLNQEPSVNARRVFGRTVRMSCQEHEYGCLLVRLPPFLSAQVLAFGSAIPDDLLAGDGRETAPHITIKYGFEDEDKDCVLAKVIEFESPSITLGKLRCFKNDDADVLYVEVDSHDLERLHTALNPLAKKKDDHPYYTPHITIAYLKPGSADPYLGDTSFEGLCFNPPKAFFSCKGGDETHAHFAECCQTEDDLVEAVTQRIFGRTVRMSTEEGPKSPLEFEHVGKFSDGSIADEQPSRIEEARRLATVNYLDTGNIDDTDFGGRRVGKYKSTIYGPRGGDIELFMTCSNDGTVVLHKHRNEDELQQEISRRVGSDWRDHGVNNAIKKSRQAYSQMHNEAVDKGNVFSRIKNNVDDKMPAMMRAAIVSHKNQGKDVGADYDHAPFLIMSDYLDENGFSDHAEELRRRHAPDNLKVGPYWLTPYFVKDMMTPGHLLEVKRRFSISSHKVFGRTVRMSSDNRPYKQLEFDWDALEKANQEPKQLRDDLTDEEKQERIKDITQSDYFLKLRKKAEERGIKTKPKMRREGLIGEFLDWLDAVGESANRSYPPEKPLPEERVPMPDTRSPEELARVQANLQAEIERARRERQVRDINSTDYFQNLRRKAQELKDKKDKK